MNGQEALARLRRTLDEGGVIMGAGAGTGLSAKCAEAGGADLIIIYNSGRYRMAGRGSLAGCMPYGDANEAGLLTTPYVFDEAQARAMADAGADVVVAHMGLTTKGQIGATTALTIEAAAERVQRIRDAAAEVNPNIIALCHGGPIAEPDDAQYVLDHTTGVAGFFGASSMERLPTEVAITENMRRFKRIARVAEAAG